MNTVVIFALVLTLASGSPDGQAMEASIAHSVFLPRSLDPFCDTYVETITHMTADQLMNLPRLNDTEFLYQLVHGIDSIPETTMGRAIPNGLFDPNIDEQIEFHSDIETEWEDLMVGGPASISYMGAVMAIASSKDFSLTADFNYKLVKYPNSFHTTLVQVSHDMYRALYGAHTGMDKIQVNMRQLPALLKTALKLITQASTAMTKAMLPRNLVNIGRYANESAAVARVSLERFESLQRLLEEVVEASTLTNKGNRNISAQYAKEAEDMRAQKVNMDRVMASIRSEYDVARQDLEKARADYLVAIANVPGGQWDPFAWNVYTASRPSETCSGVWFWRSCRDLHREQFAQYSLEARREADLALATLKRAEERSKDLFNKQMGKQDEIGAAIHVLTMIDFSEVSVNRTIEILLDAAQKISIVQAQWSRLSRFFNKLAIDTERTQRVVLEDFLGAIADAESTGEPLSLRDQFLFTSMLVNSATDIDRDSHLLFLMAKTYSDVSNAYMMDQIAGLSGLLALQTNAERELYLKGIASKTLATSIKVKNLAAERQRKYELVNYARQEQYMEFIHDGEMEREFDLLGGIGVGK